MLVQCPNCGHFFGGKGRIKGIGRNRLNIPLKNVCECLRRHSSVRAAAQELNCSEEYIFNVLKANGLRLKDAVTLR